MAWMVDGHGCTNQVDHLKFVPVPARRRHFREMLKSSEIGAQLLALERAKEPDEASEHSEDLDK